VQMRTSLDILNSTPLHSELNNFDFSTYVKQKFQNDLAHRIRNGNGGIIILFDQRFLSRFYEEQLKNCVRSIHAIFGSRTI